MEQQAPKRIFLQNGGDGYDPETWEGATWCQDRIEDSDVEYIRADLAPPVEASAAQGVEDQRKEDLDLMEFAIGRLEDEKNIHDCMEALHRLRKASVKQSLPSLMHKEMGVSFSTEPIEKLNPSPTGLEAEITSARSKGYSVRVQGDEVTFLPGSGGIRGCLAVNCEPSGIYQPPTSGIPTQVSSLVEKQMQFEQENVLCPKCCSAIPKWQIGWPVPPALPETGIADRLIESLVECFDVGVEDEELYVVCKKPERAWELINSAAFKLRALQGPVEGVK